MKNLIFVLSVVVVCVFGHVHVQPPCNAGGVCTTEDLSKLSQSELIDLVLQKQGSPAAPSNEVFWWKYPSSDCSNHDISTKCSGDVEECKALCLKTSGCSGFNTHGFLKNSDCSKYVASSTVDLYIVKDHAQKATWPFIWPHPFSYTNGTTTIYLDSINWKWIGPNHADLASAFARYFPLIFPHTQTGPVPSPSSLSLTVSIADLTAQLQAGVDESYKLIIPSDGSTVILSAQTVFGAMKGLETFSQLVYFNFDLGIYYINAAPWSVIDKPRFQHREVLLDSSRHFLPLPVLKQVVDGLMYTKINTIHWHWVDDQSFPLELPHFPNFAKMGSHSANERYTVSDAKAFVEYARQRGIRVVPEMDMPGHAASWCPGDVSLCPSATCTDPLNVARTHTFETIASMQKDLATIFPDKMMHLGGDEVDTSCWKNTPEIKSWLDSHNMTAQQGYLYFVQTVHKTARDAGRDPVGWEEIWRFFGTDLDKNTIIHQWLSGSNIAINATAHGYRVLWSTSSAWYLDWLSVTWQTMYSQEPCKGIADDICAKYLIGGGGEMWGETVDASDIQATIFPRIGAIAERLWSPKTITDLDVAEGRYAHLRCLLNSRGVGAAPYNNAQARTAPTGPGRCSQ